MFPQSPFHSQMLTCFHVLRLQSELGALLFLLIRMPVRHLLVNHAKPCSDGISVALGLVPIGQLVRFNLLLQTKLAGFFVMFLLQLADGCDFWSWCALLY